MFEYKAIVLKQSIPHDLFEKLKEETQKKFAPKNNQLAGQIRREETLGHLIPDVEPVIANEIQNYDTYVTKVIPSFLRRMILDRTQGGEKNPLKIKLRLLELWVNHMKQYEFNPIHSHDGLFSFVMFIKVPFLLEEMHKMAPGSKSPTNAAGSLTFFHPGNPFQDSFYREEIFYPDKTWEGKILIFPAYLCHQVQPFYGTEEERITISGNVYADTLVER